MSQYGTRADGLVAGPGSEFRGAPVSSPAAGAAVGDTERVALDARTGYLAVLGDPATFSQQLRLATCETLLSRRRVLIVDMSLAGPVRGLHLDELLWANERLVERGGALGVISDPEDACGALSGVAARQPPEVAGTMREITAVLGIDYGEVQDALRQKVPR